MKAAEKLARFTNAVDAKLYAKGFTTPEARTMIRNQCLTAFASLAVCVVLSRFWLWPISFALGAALAAWNFYGLAKFVQNIIFVKYEKSAIINLLVRFYGRMLATGLCIFAFIQWNGSNATALVAGLSTTLVTLFVWGGVKFLAHKPKEA